MAPKRPASPAPKQIKTTANRSRKKSELQLLIEQAALYRLSEALICQTDIQAMIDIAVNVTAELLKSEMTTIALVDEDGNTFSDKANMGCATEKFSIGQRVPLNSDNGLSYAIRHQTVVAIPDELKETRYKVPQWVLQMGVRSALIAPMIVGGKTVGGLVVNDRKVRKWSKDDERLIALVANYTAEAIERARLVEQLGKSERQFRAMIERSADAVALVNAEGIIQYQSSSAQRVLGDVRIGQNAFDLIHPDDLPQSIELFKQLLNLPKGSVITHFRFRHSHGVWIWLEATGTNLLDDPDVQAIVVNYRDINERKQAEIVVRESEERFSKAFRSSPIAVGISTLAEGRIIDVNDAYLRLFGFDSKKEVLGYTTLELNLYVMGHDERNRIFELIQRQGHIQNYETCIRTRSGEERYTLTSIERIELNNEQCLLAFAVDITERKRLELQQNRLVTALESVGEVIIITDVDGKIQYVNPAFEYITGYTTDEALGQNPNMLQSGKHGKEFYRAMWADLTKGNVWQGVITNKKKSGDMFESDETIAPIHDAAAGIIGYVAVARDITERVRYERELEAITQMSTALRIAPVLDDVMSIILDQSITLFKADNATLIMRNEVSGDLVIEALRGVPILNIGDRLATGTGVADYVIESRQPYLSQDLEKDPRFARCLIIQGQWAAVFTPLATREQIVGVLCVARQSATISNEDLRLLNMIGELAANAIHRASLFEQTRHRLEQLALLHDIDRTISSSFDLRLTLNTVLNQLASHNGVGAVSVLLFNPHLMTLEYIAEQGFHRNLPKPSQLNLNQSYAGRAVLKRQTVVADLTTSKGFPHLDALVKEGFTRYDGIPLIVKGQIKGVLEVFSRVLSEDVQSWVEFLETIGSGLAIAIDNLELFDGLQRSNIELAFAYDTTLEGWSRALELRDQETEGHTRRVTELTERLARVTGLGEIDIVHIRRGALLHDIGKMGIPDAILRKPGPLTDDEWIIMRKHPQYAYDLLAPISFLKPALDIPYCHHEKWDGTGYPRGLKGEEIPLAARIFSVADVWDALRSDRPYRKGWVDEKVCNFIREQSNKYFDPQVVENFLKLNYQVHDSV